VPGGQLEWPTPPRAMNITNPNRSLTMNHPIVSKDEWIAARKRLLAREKEFTRLRDELSQERRDLPWERVERKYSFEGAKGRQSLEDLFESRHQLIVYHFMFAPEWEAGCKSCSFWADNFNGIVAHLQQRDVSFAAVSRAPWQKLHAFAQRLGWSFNWVSSGDGDFNFDFQVSFTEQQVQGEVEYNYVKQRFPATDAPGISVFFRDGGAVFHTYSSFGRGLDMMNTAYHYLDLVPKGRDEQGLPHTMAWVKLRDQYSH
jgi:predicted dithiol-disulfide oxidoreductase (DUF899 family)